MERLRALRMERGISQQNLADFCHVSQQSIHKYENGLAEPDIEMLIRLADYFGTTIDYLVGRTNQAGSRGELSDQELLLLTRYQTLTKKEQRIVRRLMEELAKS